jgi:hypothetical protein
MKLLSITLLLAGCTTQRENMPINERVFEKPSAIVITQITGLEKPTYAMHGNQGLLEAVINEAMGSSIAEKIENLRVHNIAEEYYYQPFRKYFEERSFKVINHAQPLEREKLLPLTVEEAKYAPYNFKPLKAQFDAEYALILDPQDFGLVREYYSCLPISHPTGHTNLGIYLVRLEDNLIAGYYKASAIMSTHGEWDSPPEYQSLMDAAKNSLIKALQDAYIYFFGWKPKQIS